MATPHFSSPGETRRCPHCHATILRSAPVCPTCQRHLHFDAVSTERLAALSFCPLHLETTIRHPDSEEPWEYSIVVLVKDEQGKIITRHAAAVGALSAGDTRTFAVRVEVFAPSDVAPRSD